MGGHVAFSLVAAVALPLSARSGSRERAKILSRGGRDVRDESEMTMRLTARDALVMHVPGSASRTFDDIACAMSNGKRDSRFIQVDEDNRFTLQHVLQQPVCPAEQRSHLQSAQKRDPKTAPTMILLLGTSSHVSYHGAPYLEPNWVPKVGPFLVMTFAPAARPRRQLGPRQIGACRQSFPRNTPSSTEAICKIALRIP